ncbi:DUF2948 family protein [Phaeovulum sp.]|jgi:hypothetical protein|uniref:DUF2948 family protein n=1 Tax=Phaeovulum sp. TaxID=2934796 RepID=UPI002731B765|nr:DUF2948 family protein [Phaeovulum sp.]MDP1668376.1 DUF2948 family protein [Phaeovulum sp.]MDP2063416.1 DUF2948 family protein [Phaeovulum sp.]MDZ4120129.1 DUF2948 family protein [Phaeovulum sp.]
MSDARFEDGAEVPLRLKAETAEDLAVLAALVQDAILSSADIHYDRKARRLGLLLNRFRWEDRVSAEAQGRPFERVRALLLISDVLAVQLSGVTPGAGGTVLSLLDLGWAPGEDGSGRLTLTLAGDGAIAAEVECLNLALRDVTRPYVAPSRKAPQHPE